MRRLPIERVTEPPLAGSIALPIAGTSLHNPGFLLPMPGLSGVLALFDGAYGFQQIPQDRQVILPEE